MSNAYTIVKDTIKAYANGMITQDQFFDIMVALGVIQRVKVEA